MLETKNRPIVLVIDDEAAVLEEVSRALEPAGFRCHCCQSAAAAIGAAAHIVPELIISDINLAGESGLVLCERLRTQFCLEDVPMMFLSGAQIPDIVSRSHAAGGTYYLRKPFDPQVLVELVDKAMWMPHLVRHQVMRRRQAMAEYAATI
ncbi:MAG: response regulator [Planctomycetales bacterium]|nr:response regulator [Planctomycetales bacterium]